MAGKEEAEDAVGVMAVLVEGLVMKHWRTTVGGIALALGGPLAAAGEGWVQIAGVVLSSLGSLLLGVSAPDRRMVRERIAPGE